MKERFRETVSVREVRPHLRRLLEKVRSELRFGIKQVKRKIG